MPSRRRFLLNCSTIAAISSVAPSHVFGASRIKEVPLDQIGVSAFTAHMNSVFRVQAAGGKAAALKLVEVRQAAPAQAAAVANAEDAANEKFTLLFRGARSQPLGQDSYWFENTGIGRFQIFIVPTATGDTRHWYYEATFNRRPGSALPRAGAGNIPLRINRPRAAQN